MRPSKRPGRSSKRQAGPLEMATKASSSDMLAVVPGRGGSKRLPGKNIRTLGGKPLLCHTVDAALASGVFAEIMVNSDSDQILQVLDRYRDDPRVVPRKRPVELAQDTTKVIDLILALAKEPEIAERFDRIALLLPTCPFRTPEDLRQGSALLTPNWDSVVSLTAYEFPYAMSTRLGQEAQLEPVFDPSPLVTGNTRSQDHAPVYHPNGGFYMAWRQRLVDHGNYFRGRVRGHVMDRLNSADIDDETDFQYAEFLFSSGAVPGLAKE